jgi:broad specificity phosphatase PhoE
VRTAEIAFGNRIPLTVDARLRECDYGDLTRQPTAAIEAQRPERVHTPFPGGESYDACVGRMASFLADISDADVQPPVLIVGHRATWYSLECLLRHRPLADVLARPWQWQPGWKYRLPK